LLTEELSKNEARFLEQENIKLVSITLEDFMATVGKKEPIFS